MEKKLIYSGSVKEIYQLGDKRELLFKFSDRYSIFDWGEMPDHIENKGKALSFMGAFFFKHLGSLNIRTHFIELTQDKELKVRKVNVFWPESTISEGEKKWHYQYSPETNDALIPLEVIFRFGAPEGSSLLKRIKNSTYAGELGVSPDIKLGQMFDKVVIEFSTKLEPEDRYLSYSEAQKMAALNNEEWKKLLGQTQKIAQELKKVFEKLSIELWDGKLEFALDEKRNLMLVDSIGPDEMRLLYKGKQLSKEYLRQYYRKSPWYEAIEKAKKAAQKDPYIDWKEYCIEELKQQPQKLPPSEKEKITQLYTFLTNELLQLGGESKVFEQDLSFDEFLESF